VRLIDILLERACAENRMAGELRVSAPSKAGIQATEPVKVSCLPEGVISLNSVLEFFGEEIRSYHYSAPVP
jgi:hypothetical protein